MKKLGNGGWSLSTMVGFLCVLILFIIVVAILAYRFEIDQESTKIQNQENIIDTD